MSFVPRSLFGRTAVLIATTLLLFTMIAWQALVWTVVLPASTLAVEVLAQRAHTAVAARRTGQAMPQDTRFETQEPARVPWHYRGSAYATYVEAVRADLSSALNVPDVRLDRFAAPAEFWVRLPEVPDAWLVLSWRVARPKAPAVGLFVLAVGALIVLAGAALSARRLTAPLAALADAAGAVCEGRRVHIATDAGPSEVRSLATAFASMSQRLAALDEQRELMLGGISHDLRTPLARIRVAIELLEGQPPALLDEMTASVAEMDRMIGQFLHFVRANYRETPSIARADDIVRQTLAIYGQDARLTLQLQADAPQRFAVDCLRHTLLNLVQNALDYGAAPVVVRTTLLNGALHLSVADAGAGLDPERWQEALQPFHRLDAPPSQGHSGLGLALVARLIHSCGGRLSCARRDQSFIIDAQLPIGDAP